MIWDCDSKTRPLDLLGKLAPLKVEGSIIPVLEDKNGLADAIVDPKDGQAATGFCVGGAKVGWVGVNQNEGRKGSGEVIKTLFIILKISLKNWAHYFHVASVLQSYSLVPDG